VYAFFSIVYKTCYFVGVGGYAAVVFQGMFGPVSTAILQHSMMACFYGVYFGVLCRDCAEMCAEAMSNTLGVRSSVTGVGWCSFDECVCCLTLLLRTVPREER